VAGERPFPSSAGTAGEPRWAGTGPADAAPRGLLQRSSAGGAATGRPAPGPRSPFPPVLGGRGTHFWGRRRQRRGRDLWQAAQLRSVSHHLNVVVELILAERKESGRVCRSLRPRKLWGQRVPSRGRFPRRAEHSQPWSGCRPQHRHRLAPQESRERRKTRRGKQSNCLCGVHGKNRSLLGWDQLAELTRTLSLVIRILFSLISHSCFGLIVSSVGGADLRAQLRFPPCHCALAGSSVGAASPPSLPPSPGWAGRRAHPGARNPARRARGAAAAWTGTRTPQPRPCLQRAG